MSNFAKVVDEKGLVREMHSKAILNTDHDALKEHRRKKEMMKETMNNSKKINQMEKDIEEIKNMLISMTQNTKG